MAKKKVAKVKKHNPSDLTLRNLRAMKKRIESMEQDIRNLYERVESLEGDDRLIKINSRVGDIDARLQDLERRPVAAVPGEGQ